MSTEDDELTSLMAALKTLGNKPVKPKSAPKKKKKKKKPTSRKSIDEGGGDGDEFVYQWQKCSCGMQHPPVPSYHPPDGKRCTFYWQVADSFPFMTLHRVLTTEIKFIEADEDQSGLLELKELQVLMEGLLGTKNVSPKIVEKTFNEIDTDGSGNIDFLEVLAIVDAMVQRNKTNLPSAVQNEYSKTCSIQ
ncbi:hypothetical protein ACF0H5_002736 [Mactra antiquata]